MKEFDGLSKTPRTFRNELFVLLVDMGASEDVASAIAGDAELCVEAYEQYKLRDITYAAESMNIMNIRR